MMFRLPSYNRLTNTTIEDDLLNGSDCRQYSRLIRFGLVVHYFLKRKMNRIGMHHYQRWQNEQAPNADGAASDSPSKLTKMWKRVKKAFGGGHDSQERSKTNEGIEAAAGDLDVGHASSAEAVVASTSATTVARKPPTYIYCGRYTNPGYIYEHCTNHGYSEESASGPTFNSIKNANIEEIDVKVKVEAWVAHLDNPLSSNLSTALMSSTSSASS